MKIMPTVLGVAVAGMTLGFAVGCSDAGNADSHNTAGDNLGDAATPQQHTDAAAVDAGAPLHTDAAAAMQPTDAATQSPMDAATPVQPTDAAVAISQCTIGNFNPLPGYNAALWVGADFFASGSTACVNYYGGTNYTVVWNGNYHGYDVLGGMGLADINKKIDSVNADASGRHDHMFASTNSGQGVFSLYGRGKSSGLEWYIVDDWFGPKPNGRGAQYLLSSIDVDGDTYDVYKYTGTLAGTNAPFYQWWSIRRTARTTGVISYAKHYQKWRSLGMPNELMREVRFLVEANGPVGRGKLDVYSLDLLSHKP